VPVSSVSSTIEASSTFNPGVILLQSAVTGGPTAEVSVTTLCSYYPSLIHRADQPDRYCLYSINDAWRCRRLSKSLWIRGKWRSSQRFLGC
jgi:hypothetical protein